MSSGEVCIDIDEEDEKDNEDDNININHDKVIEYDLCDEADKKWLVNS